jgi:metal-sulfur cluster biosynthetic enzyme
MKTNNPNQSGSKMLNNSYSEKKIEGLSPSQTNDNELNTQTSDPIKRRKFLGMSLLGMAGLSLPYGARAGENNAVEDFVKGVIAEETELFKKQSDTFETKIKLIEKAWAEKDYRMVRSLSDSLRNTGIQAQIEDEDPGKPLVGSSEFGSVATLPTAWKTWANGWKYYKVIGLEEKAGIKRNAEPVEVLLAFRSEQVTSLAREIRVAEINNGQIKEVTSQVYGVVRRGTERLCKVMFLADNQGGEKRNYLVFFGNPDAELPEYTTDLEVSGEGYHLKIENQYFIASLSKQTGQLERMLVKREHGVELYAGGPGHGETTCIDWAHDYVTEDNFMKVRIQYWGECPDYEIIRGPICTIVRRWGFPHSALHPIYNPSRLNIDIEYRFYAGLPFFHKFGKMKAVKQFISTALRDDEWVFTGQPFTGSLWMGVDEKLKFGEIDEANKHSVKAFGYYNKDSKDSFIGLYLEHSAEEIPKFLHAGHSLLYYNWHGTTWSRYPLERNQLVPEGAVLHQKNAYVTVAFTEADGPAKIEALRKELLSPLTSVQAILPAGIAAKENKRVLAREGEAQNGQISKQVLWDALKNCKDQQLYIADVNIVELGYIYNLSMDDDGVVKVLMTMPHRGRPLSSFFIWGSSVVHRTVSKTIMGALSEIPGVRKVIVDQTWYPEWNSNFISEEGRKKLGI